MFLTTFYIFSLLLSYTDYKRFIVPNNILLSMLIMLLFTGIIEDKIYISSVVVPLIVLLLFIVLLLLNPKMILGGGDIKYIMIVSFYLPWTLFPLFLIVTGTLQTFSLLYIQIIKKRRIVAMVPVMFISAIITEIIQYYGFNPLG
ncbi:MAG: prepilin peptidase [Arcobacteraceae bacterium]|nr:prepilin peptidase [Arcobacteraceae bacterium]